MCLFTSSMATEKLKGVSVNLAGVIDQDGNGREMQIMKSVFKCMGKEFSLTQVPYGRHLLEFNNSKSYDFVTTVPPSTKLKGFSSVSHIGYYNGVITSKSLSRNISSLDDLKGLNVIAFQGAQDILPGLALAKKNMKSYKETTKQEIQSRLLLAGRMDAVISDSVIFLRYMKKIKPSAKKVIEKDMKFKFSSIFPTSHFHVQFLKESVQADFNKCFKKLEKSGDIDRINHEYLVNIIYQVI